MKKISTVLFILILMIAVNQVSGAFIKDITTTPTDIRPGDKFTITTELTGTTCGMVVRFYIGDEEFSSRYVKDCGDSVDSAEWDLDKNPLDCGVYNLKVELVDDGNVVQTEERKLPIGNVPNIEIIPPRPNPDSEIIFRFTDNETGNRIKNLNVDIYEKKSGSESKATYSTNSNGEFTFITNRVGEYRLEIHSSKYCGSTDFFVKKKLPYDGPNPSNPVVGDLISLGVPAGVGVKYIDSEGNVYPLRNVGGINFTIEKPGEYTIVMGELSTIYWSERVPINVSEKGKMQIELEPEEPVIDKPMTIRVTSGGTNIEGADVRITMPNGDKKSYETDSVGEVKFTPIVIGEYTLHIEKRKYTTIDTKFTAQSKLNVRIIPTEPIRNQDVILNVTDQFGMPVVGASITIEDNGIPLITGSSDDNGEFKFKLPEEKEYTLIVKRDNFWDFTQNLRAYGAMSLLVSADYIEVGDKISLSVVDSEGKEITAKIVVERPDGIIDSVEGNEYIPERVGEYKIDATKTNYKSVSKKIIVNPHPLTVIPEIEGDLFRIKVTSREEPIVGITVVLRAPGGEEKELTTDATGTVKYKITGDGIFTISVNSIRINGDYESKILNRQIIKAYNPLFLIIPIIFVIIFAFIFIAIIEYLHKARERSKKKKSKLSNATSKKSSLKKGQTKLSSL